jgi:hypothetical protein
MYVCVYSKTPPDFLYQIDYYLFLINQPNSSTRYTVYYTIRREIFEGKEKERENKEAQVITPITNTA